MATSGAKITVYHTIETDDGYAASNESFKTALADNMSSDTAAAFINWAQNYVTSLSNETYEYSKIVKIKSLNEILAEE